MDFLTVNVLPLPFGLAAQTSVQSSPGCADSCHCSLDAAARNREFLIISLHSRAGSTWEHDNAIWEHSS
jgi:hypothetical protein